MPGGQYKKRAAECRLLAGEVLNSLVKYVIKNMDLSLSSSKLTPNTWNSERVVRPWIARDIKEHEEAIKAVAVSAFIGM